MRRWTLWALLALVGILATPLVSACDIAPARAPPPARLYVWDLEREGLVAWADPETRRLSGDCSLSLATDLDEDRLVWGDTDRPPGGSRGIWLMDLSEAGNEPTLVRDAPDRYMNVDLTGDTLLFTAWNLENEHDPAVYRLDLRTLEEDRLPVEFDGIRDIRMGDGFVAWTTHNEMRDPEFLNVYDAIEQEWVLKDAPLEQWGLEGMDIASAGDPYLLLRQGRSSYRAIHVHNHEIKDLTPILNEEARIRTILGETLVQVDREEIQRTWLGHTPFTRTYPVPPYPYHGPLTHDNLVLLSHYSAPEQVPGDVLLPQEGDGQEIPMMSWGIVLLLLIAKTVTRRRSGGPPPTTSKNLTP